MKITKSQLKQIIKEELEAELNEGMLTDIMGILFPTDSQLEKRRKMAAMSDEEIAAMIVQARENEARGRRGRTSFEPKYISPDIEKRVGDITSEKDAERQAQAAQEEEERLAQLSQSDKASERRAARKAKRTRELAAATERNKEKRAAAAAARANLEEAILRKVLRKLR